ncbi:MAG: hypothetical protein Q9199_003439 [Rusavskia elegans]
MSEAPVGKVESSAVLKKEKDTEVKSKHANRRIEHVTSPKTYSVPKTAFTRAMDEFTIAMACLTLESKDRHRKDAAGLVATVLYAQANDTLSPNRLALLIEPVPRMLQDERAREVWIKVINLWLKEYRAHLFPKVDRLLDPYVMGAVNTLLEDEHRLRQI